MKKLVGVLCLVALCFTLAACEETEEAFDNNNDIILRNTADFDLWIMIDGSRRGRIENDGIARTMWDGIPDDIHLIQAFLEDGYLLEHCWVETDFLDDGEDFYWYLEDDNQYSGTKSGNC